MGWWVGLGKCWRRWEELTRVSRDTGSVSVWIGWVDVPLGGDSGASCSAFPNDIGVSSHMAVQKEVEQAAP